MVGDGLESSTKRKRSSEDINDEGPEQKKLRYCLESNSPRKKTLGPDIPLTSPESGESRTDEVSSETDSLCPDVASPGQVFGGTKSSISDRQHLLRSIRSPSGSCSSQQTAIPFERRLKLNFKYLKDELEPNSFKDRLFEAELIDNEQLEMITECRSRRRKADLLLKAIAREIDKVQDNIEHIEQKVFKALKDSGHGHLWKTMKTKDSTIICKYEQNPNVLLQFLSTMEKEIQAAICPKEFIDDLVVVNGITLSDHEDIWGMLHRKDRVAKIIELARDPANKENIVKVIGTLINKHPQLYDTYKSKLHGIDTGTTPKDLVVQAGGQLKKYPMDPVSPENGVNVKIKLNFQLSDNNRPIMQDSAGLETELRNVEKRTVALCNGNISVQAQITEDLMGECAVLFGKMKVSSVVIHLSAWSEKAVEEILRACKEGRPISWLSKLLLPTDLATLERLGVDTVEVEVCVGNRPARLSECHCILTKQQVVKNYSKLLLHMRGCRKAIHRFMELDLISETQKIQLGRVLRVKHVPSRNEDLLRFLVDGTYPAVLLCILEEELRRHGCQNLLDTIANASRSSDNQTSRLTTKDLVDYKEYLTEELDARCFMPAFSARIQGESASKLAEYVMGSAPRRRRMEHFLNYLCQNGSDLKWFTETLKNQKLGYVLDHVLKRTEDSKSSFDSRYITWASVVRHCDLLMEEVDIVQLRGQLLGAALINSSAMAQLETIPSRKGRMAMFIKVLQERNDETAAQFVQILRDSGYEWIGAKIEKVAKDEYTCPRIASIGEKASYDTLVLKGMFNVKIAGRNDSHEEPVLDLTEYSQSCDSMIVLDDSADSDVICLTDDSVIWDMASTSSHSRAETEVKDPEPQPGTITKTKQWVERHFSSDSSLSEKSDNNFLLPSSPRSPGAAMKPSRRPSVSKGFDSRPVTMSSPSLLGACLSPLPSLGSEYRADSIMSSAGLRFKETESIATVSSPIPTESGLTLNSPCPTDVSSAVNSPVPTESRLTSGLSVLIEDGLGLHSPMQNGTKSFVLDSPTETKSSPMLNSPTQREGIPLNVTPSSSIFRPSHLTMNTSEGIAPISVGRPPISTSRSKGRPPISTSRSKGRPPISTSRSKGRPPISTSRSIDSKSTNSAVERSNTIEFSPAGFPLFQGGRRPLKHNPLKKGSVVSPKHRIPRPYQSKHHFVDYGDNRKKHKYKWSGNSYGSINSTASTEMSGESVEPTETMEMSVSEDEMEVLTPSLYTP